MNGPSFVQGSEWFVTQVALLHTWAGEDQCRVNPLQGYYLSHTHWDLIIIIIIIICILEKQNTFRVRYWRIISLDFIQEYVL